MRVLVTGADGFVGRWLTRELEGAGHDVLAINPGVDVRDANSVADAVRMAKPGGIAHLAAVSFGPDASADPGKAFATAVGGTVNVLESARLLSDRPAVLVAGSSEVYGSPTTADLPLTEDHPLRAQTAYGLSKIAQESVAIAYANRYGLSLVVTRSFNHIGPGQRPDFVVPALAQRIAAVARGDTDRIPVGNVDVRRDLTDVRDVARAYRLLLEAAAEKRQGANGLVVNVCSGESVAIRWVVEELCRLTGMEPSLEIDRALVRESDAPEIRGDYSLLGQLTGWRPTISLPDTLREIWNETAQTA